MNSEPGPARTPLLHHPVGRPQPLQWQPPGIVLPGSFNPLHEGHRQLMAAACRRLNTRNALFELSIRNVDKPDLPQAELEKRLRQFKDYAPVAVTAEPLFSGKARLFPGAAFAIGVDTLQRIVSPRYYSGAEQRNRALSQIARHRCRLIVGGRADSSGTFMTAAEIDIPPALKDTIEVLSEAEFRQDVTSTRIRQAQGGDNGDQ